MNDYLQYLGVGLEIVVTVLLCALIGYGLDRWMETEKPWFLLGFALLGCVLVIYRLIVKFGRPS